MVPVSDTRPVAWEPARNDIRGRGGQVEADGQVPATAVPDDAAAVPPRRRAFAGEPRQARYARRFVKDALNGCPVVDTIVLLADELVTNALMHTRSGRGGLFEVIAWNGSSSACVAVFDDGAEGEPSPADSDAMSESGRGLALVDALATRWGHAGDSDGRVTWFVVRWPAEARRLPCVSRGSPPGRSAGRRRR